MNEPDIRTYSNYREYLKDFFHNKKSANSSYSHRLFAKKADISSPSHLKMVMDGQRNLTGKTIRKYVKAIGFKKREADFFELLVSFNQENKAEEKIELFQKLMAEKRKKGLSDLEEVQFDFLTHWHYVAIYVLLDLADFKNTPEWIQSKLNKKVSTQNIQKALEDLEKLNLIEKCKIKGWKQSQGALDTSDEIQSMAFRRYHKNMSDLAVNSLNEVQVDHREFNGVTIPVNTQDLDKIKKMIREFRKELNEVASNMETPDSVYQMNIQFFPLTEVNQQ